MKQFWVATVIVVLYTPTPTLAQNTAHKQNESFEQGANLISAGIGFGGAYHYWNKVYTRSPDFVLAYEKGLAANVGPGTLSLGVFAGYKSMSYSFLAHPNYQFSYKQNWKYGIIGLRAAYHWDFMHSPKCDPYIGAMIAYYAVYYTVSTNDTLIRMPTDPYYYIYSQDNHGYIAPSFFLGFRYYISRQINLWAEGGYGYAYLTVGIGFKFGGDKT